MNKRDKKNFVVQRKLLQLEQQKFDQQSQKYKKEIDKQIWEIEKEVKHCSRLLMPDQRRQLFDQCKEVRESALFEFFQEKKNPPENGQDWEKEEQRYKGKIKEELHHFSIRNRGVILIICRNYRASQGIDAIRNEAFQVFQFLKKTVFIPFGFFLLSQIRQNYYKRERLPFFQKKMLVFM